MSPSQLSLPVSDGAEGSTKLYRECREVGFDVWSAAGRRKLGRPETWQWYRVESIGPDVLVTGGIPNPGATNRKMWRGVKGEKVVITPADRAAAEQEYERTTGKCYECSGTGEVLKRWNHETGCEYKPCERCQPARPPGKNQ